MLTLVRRAPAARRGRPNRIVLRLNEFESRATPSNDITQPDSPPVFESGNLTTNVAPQITNFTANPLGGGTYRISGRVIDVSPGGLTVSFSGSVATLNGYTTTTAADGTFSFDIQLQTNGTDTGYLFARTRDAQGLISNEPSVSIDPTL
jgi:hypothetical protein